MQHYDHDAELAVLRHISQASTLSLEEARSKLQRSGLSVRDFHLPANAKLFEVSSSMLEAGQPVDPLTLRAFLDSRGGLAPVGGTEHMLSVTTGLEHLSDSSLLAYSSRLRNLAVRRAIVSKLKDALSQAESERCNPDRLIGELHSGLSSVASQDSRFLTLRESMDELLGEYESRQESGQSSVVPTGIKQLDEIIGGWQPTLNLVGALPGVGKSAVFASSIKAIASSGVKAGLFSLEDEASFLGWRIWSHESQVDHFVLRFLKNGDKAKAKALAALQKMEGYWENVVLRDGSDSLMDIDRIVSDCHSMILNHGVRIIFVDHLGEIAHDAAEERYDLVVAQHLSALRRVANTHGVPVVVAAHLRRRQGGDTGTAPTLQDFANSSGAERKARVAIGLSRPQDSDTITLHVLKNTNGKSGLKVDAVFHGASGMLADEAEAAVLKQEQAVAMWDKWFGEDKQ